MEAGFHRQSSEATIESFLYISSENDTTIESLLENCLIKDKRRNFQYSI